MRIVASSQSYDVAPDQLGAIVSAYLAVERARVYRRLFVFRFGLFAAMLGIIGVGFRWLSPLASSLSVGLCLVAPLWAWIAELRCNRRLTRRLEQVPAHSHRASPVRKS